ncbi:MAG TPA: lytic transglycosylase domain-containing protein [Thermoanaerobaculia bacterium]|nr:lytic transglycosylase domain-containing protein [Thermoanaerobaculia bacterium]
MSFPSPPSPPLRAPVLAAVTLLIGFGASRALADVPAVSSDYDAEFARAVDLLEEGKHADAEAVLEAIRKSARLPSWDARAALLLAVDDANHDRWAEAAEHLTGVSAAPIGLEAYRELRLSESLELSGKSSDALQAAERALATEGEFAFRTRAALQYARLLERAGRLREASDALTQASGSAAGVSERGELAIARIRLGIAMRDPARTREAARDLLLEAPGWDTLSATPAFAKQAASEAEGRLTPAERGRLGRALVGAGESKRGVKLLSKDAPSAWPSADRGANLLARARGELAMKKEKAADATATSIANDGSEAYWQSVLFRSDLVLARLRRGDAEPPGADDPRVQPVRHALEGLANDASTPAAERRGAHERLLRLFADGDDFDQAIGQARAIVLQEGPGSDGFETIWRMAWKTYAGGDARGARERIEAAGSIYSGPARSRRLAYWRARCLAEEKREAEARPIFAELAAASPADVYAIWARARVPSPAKLEREEVRDPSTATAAFARVDELLRLRMFAEASAEARSLKASRGRDLRLAQSDFALGRFPAAAAAIKRAIPEVGTAEEGRVPDAWRRIYYPIEEGGFLASRATEFGLDPSVLRALVRQESVFDATAKSRAGAMGLTQLMPATAKSLAKSVLRARYRRAFLYDPGVNARLGAAYLKRLLDEFGGSVPMALAAYNGGPTRIHRIARENAGRPEDEVFEKIPLYETRDYVRRVMLYAESYKELYP